MLGKLQSTPASAGTSEESSEQPSQHQSTNQNNNPFLNIISSFTELFNLIFPLQKKKKNQAVEESADVNEVNTEAESTVVRFPLVKYESFPSVKLEPDEIQERNTNPVVLWQTTGLSSVFFIKSYRCI